MRRSRSRLLVPAALVALSLLAGCAPFPLKSAPAGTSERAQLLERPREATGTIAVAGASGPVSIGGDLQRTADGRVGGRVWVMDGEGAADLAGVPPLRVAAVDDKGKRTVLWEADAFPKGSGTVVDARGTFAVKLPVGTQALVLSTGMKRVGSSDPFAEATVAVTDLPTVDVLREW